MAEPDLARAHPSGAVAGTYEPRDHLPLDVLMDDGTWAYCEAMGWARDITGAWRIQLLWYGTDSAGHASTFESWFLYDAGRLREAAEPARPDREADHDDCERGGGQRDGEAVTGDEHDHGNGREDRHGQDGGT
jgi:hypothetical protein